MQIAFWNVRNLSFTLNRPGAVDSAQQVFRKIQAIGKNLAQSRTDIAVLIELGSDGADVASRVAAYAPGYAGIASGLTGSGDEQEAETYGVVYNTNTVSPVQFPGPEGAIVLLTDIVNYRQAAVAGFQTISGRNLLVAAYHGPSVSGAAAAIRLNLISKMLAALSNQFPVAGFAGVPVFFGGDFNIKAEEGGQAFDTMNAVFIGNGFKFLGPGTLAVPQATSLKKLPNILLNSNYDSQPYDRIYVRGADNITSANAHIGNVELPARLTASFYNDVLRKIEDIGFLLEGFFQSIKMKVDAGTPVVAAFQAAPLAVTGLLGLQQNLQTLALNFLENQDQFNADIIRGILQPVRAANILNQTNLSWFRGLGNLDGLVTFVRWSQAETLSQSLPRFNLQLLAYIKAAEGVLQISAKPGPVTRSQAPQIFGNSGSVNPVDMALYADQLSDHRPVIVDFEFAPIS